MDFSYYNNNNKVKLNIEIGSNWESLNIQNKQLNTIFSKIDDGDRKISENELTLLEKILKKADNILIETSNNNILENEELDEVINQIDKGEIKLSKKNIAKIPENLYATGYIEIQHSNKQVYEIRQDSKKFYQAEEDKIRKNLLEKYPEGEYELDIHYNGRGYSYEVYCINCDKPSGDAKTLSQKINILRADGIELGFEDFYNGSISNDDTADYNKKHQSASFGTFTITDKNGNTHEISYQLQDCFDKDVLDCRRTRKNIADFVANLPEDIINKLIENKVENIEFSSNYDDPFLADENYYRNQMDADGNVIDIGYGQATIISPAFATPKREYKKEQNIIRDDGYSINITDKENNSAEMTFTLPNKKQVTFNIEGTSSDKEGDKFHQFQVPKLVDMLKSLPESVLEDLSNEISGIKFLTEHSDGNGIYALGSDVISFKADYQDDTPAISFVHELGHAIDNQNGTMLSKSPEFANKFKEFKTLLSKFVSVEWNHAMDMPEEFFASTYAYQQLPNDNTYNNWIANIDNDISEFKNSNDPEKIKCYQLFEELKSDVSNYVNQTRNKPSQQRVDNSVATLVRKECRELINKFKDSYVNQNMLAESVELELTQALSLDDNGFASHIKSWEKYANDERYNMLDQHLPTPKEVQELFSELIKKALELRAKVKK